MPSFGALDRTSGDASTLLFFSQKFIWERALISPPKRLSFNLTLLITGVFAVSAGASPNSITLCSLAAVWSIGVGGNLPVDSAVFLGLLPAPPIWTRLTGLFSRIRPRITSISVDRPVHLVGSGATSW